MKNLTNKQILLAVSGSIAAYKAPDIIRRLQDFGATVRVILTAGGAKFITELSLQAISKHRVHDNLWDKAAELSMGHIELAKWADAVIIAPASANTIANLASGKACDLLTNVVLASDCKILLAPAMNQQMYANEALQSNLTLLTKRNIKVINPEHGEQACGDIGLGRLCEPYVIAEQVALSFTSTKLSGKKILITLGATIEPIDAVRYISNHSSGKMGMALASACVDCGAQVSIIYGNITIPLIDRVISIGVTSALEMHDAVMDNITNQDIFISCAAVGDYRAKNVATNKIKKTTNEATIELIQNPDILKDVCDLENKPICIGFAAETDNLIKNAQNKLQNKGCDAIILNDVSSADFGFKKDTNEVIFLDHKQQIKIAKSSKQKIARKIVQILINKFL